jgi:Protein of unknown function (DUF664)
MTSTSDLLVDAFGRIREQVDAVLDGLSPQQLAVRLDGTANPIGWLVWHLTRVQDDHLADAAGTEQVWTGGGWPGRLGLPYPPDATGYGQSDAEVKAFRDVPAEALAEYHAAVHERTVGYLRGLSGQDLDRVVDDSWDPPVTLAVRLVSVVSDDLQHVGQAALVRGLLPGD